MGVFCEVVSAPQPEDLLGLGMSLARLQLVSGPPKTLCIGYLQASVGFVQGLWASVGCAHCARYK